MTGPSGSRLLVFYGIKCPVRCVEKGSDGIGILGITGDPRANGKGRLFGVSREKVANSACYQCGRCCARLWQDQRELIAALPRRGIDGPATVRQGLSHPAKRTISNEMTKSIVDLFQSIEVQQEKRKFPLGTPGSADLCLQNLEKTAVIGQPSQRITRCLTPESIFKRALLGDIDSNDFVPGKIPAVVTDTATA